MLGLRRSWRAALNIQSPRGSGLIGRWGRLIGGWGATPCVGLFVKQRHQPFDRSCVNFDKKSHKGVRTVPSLQAAQHDHRWSFAFFLSADCIPACDSFFGPSSLENLGWVWRLRTFTGSERDSATHPGCISPVDVGSLMKPLKSLVLGRD